MVVQAPCWALAMVWNKASYNQIRPTIKTSHCCWHSGSFLGRSFLLRTCRTPHSMLISDCIAIALAVSLNSTALYCLFVLCVLNDSLQINEVEREDLRLWFI